MRVLLVSATDIEIAPLLQELDAKWAQSGLTSFRRGNLTLDILVTGVGMVRTTYALTKAISSSKPDLCINMGIAGAFPGKFKIGDVVHVVKDAFTEMGATDEGGDHLSMKELGLSEDIANDELINSSASRFKFLPKATGITVNAVHGDLHGIMRIQGLHDPDVETMESAAIFYTCLKEDIEFLCIRSISNIVEPRNRAAWDIDKAITALNEQVKEILVFLST